MTEKNENENENTNENKNPMNQKSKIKNQKSTIIIPARYASTRFPGKPLIDIKGKTMVQRVYEQAGKSELATQVIVATDDERIFDHVQSFDGKVVMTSNLHKTGTERCAEVAADLETDIIINVQGDEPFIAPQQIDLLIDFLDKKPQFAIGTLAKQLKLYEKLCNPNTVKVIFNQLEEAIYFSRHPIPFSRDDAPENWLTKHTYYKHIGMYGYRRDTLLRVAQLPPTPLEQAESLEQLRWLENGIRIGITTTNLDTVSIDTPEDLLKIMR